MSTTEASTATVIARVPVGLKRELEARALEHDRSVSAEMRVMLRGALRAGRQPSRETES